MKSSVLTLDSEHSSVISRAEKLEYISTRLKNHELNAFMNLANEINFCNLSRENLEELFDMFQHILDSCYKSKWKTKWTCCPIREIEESHSIVLD